MTLLVGTKAFVGWLTDLLQTAGNDPDLRVLNGVLVHTTRGHWGSEPGQVDLLAGLSTNRFTVGHTWIYCSGQLGNGPMWWDRADIESLLAVLKPRAQKPDQMVELSLVSRAKEPLSDDDQGHDGRYVQVEEGNKDLFGDGFTCSFPSRDPSDFPGQSVYRLLSTRPTGEWVDRETEAHVDAVRRTDLSSVHLQPFLTVGKRHGGFPIQVYRAHQNQAVHVQIGDNYVGALMPARFGYGEDGDFPTVEIYPPAWPATPGDTDDLVDVDAVLVPNVDTSKSGKPDDEDDPDQIATDDLEAEAGS